ncbi:type II toxin-antitoxin system HicB family antitoxin, partial [Selenomonas sp. oral taxon 126]
MKHYYPAVFETAEEGGYTVTIPDIEGCFTEGRTLEQA